MLTPSSDTVTAATVTITATRSPEAPRNVPAAVSVQSIEHDALGVNLSESLALVPGLLARERQNYAQDTQISVRGFGARATFGIRGVRVYVDGIPANQPDGQGQVSQVNLDSAARVEVLRGPFSTLYGNAAGGVIQLFTAEGHGPPDLEGAVTAGSFGEYRAYGGSQGELSGWHDLRYNLAYSRFHTEGFRDHSAAQRASLQGKFSVELTGRDRLTLLVNAFDAPHASDPMGLTRAQYDADPRQASPAALQFNTRKDAAQRQAGAVYELTVSEQSSLSLMAYTGHRTVLQFLSIPVAAEADPRHPGGVVDLDTHYVGSELRWTWRGQLAGRTWETTVGTTYDALTQQRRGYLNFNGSTLGVEGALRRDQLDRAWDVDQYLQSQWQFVDRAALFAGLRHTDVRFHSTSNSVSTADSGSSAGIDYAATTPVAGLLVTLTPALNLYAAYGQGFETPTLAELAYRSDGAPGLNLGLGAPRTQSLEVGAKWHDGDRLGADLSVFHESTNRELVVASNVGGRSTYANAAQTRRQGIEGALHSVLVGRLSFDAAGTWLAATVQQPYRTCASTPCVLATTTVPAGARTPGVPDLNFYAQLRWGVAEQGSARGWDATIGLRYVDSVPVDDLNSASAPAYALMDASVGYTHQLDSGTLHAFVRLDNLLDRRYLGSVIVNESNARYYEPGTDRAVLVGIRFFAR
jgi:iron complex outermembrane receptor protein